MDYRNYRIKLKRLDDKIRSVEGMAAADDVVLVEIETELNELMDWTELWINMLFQADQIQKGCFNAEGFYPTPYW